MTTENSRLLQLAIDVINEHVANAAQIEVSGIMLELRQGDCEGCHRIPLTDFFAAFDDPTIINALDWKKIKKDIENRKKEWVKQDRDLTTVAKLDAIVDTIEASGCPRVYVPLLLTIHSIDASVFPEFADVIGDALKCEKA